MYCIFKTAFDGRFRVRYFTYIHIDYNQSLINHYKRTLRYIEKERHPHMRGGIRKQQERELNVTNLWEYYSRRLAFRPFR